MEEYTNIQTYKHNELSRAYRNMLHLSFYCLVFACKQDVYSGRGGVACLNIKMSSYQYMDSYHKDNTVL